MMNFNLKRAFSLTENLAVITIIGLIAVLTIPNMVQKRVIKNNKIAVRKIVHNYQKLLERSLIMQTGQTNKSTFHSKLFGNNCENVNSSLWSLTESDNCYFTTADGVQWYITTDYALIKLKGIKEKLNASNLALIRQYANDPNNLNAFYITYSITTDNMNRQIEMLTDFSQNGNEVVGKTRNFITNE